MAHILVVEDEAKLLNHLKMLLCEHGFSVDTCQAISDLERKIEAIDVQADVIVLDRLLHGQDSVRVIGSLKTNFSKTKVLVLSAINSSAEKAAVLDQGADDYLAKPFDSEELIARLKVLLRRDRSDLLFGNLALNADRRSMIVDGQESELQNKEFLLLRALMQSPGKVFDKSFLYDHVWRVSADVESNVIEATVNKLRRRLKELGATVAIKNARNRGYWIEE